MGRLVWMEQGEEEHIATELERLKQLDWLLWLVDFRQELMRMEKRRMWLPKCVSFRSTIANLETEFFMLIREYRQTYKRDVPVRIKRYAP